MISFAFWIKSPGAREPAGPLTFPELRALMQSGLVTGDTLLADDDFLYQPLREFTALWEALNDPSVEAVVRQPSTRVAHREEVARNRDTNTAAPILNPQAGDVIDFEAVRRGERGFAAYDVLALNRSKEPEKVIKMLPWYKGSRIRDLRRWLVIVLICLALFLIRFPESTNPFEMAAYVLTISGSFWHIFFIDYHWHGKD